MSKHSKSPVEAMRARLIAAGYQPWEGPQEPGYMYAESPDGTQFRAPSMVSPEALARWRRQLEEEANATAYDRRCNREAKARYLSLGLRTWSGRRG